MASNGLSLVGFMDQPQALSYLRFACKPASETVSDTDLIKEWNAAQAKLGALNPNAGSPKIEDLPASHASYATSFLHEPWIQLSLKQFPGIAVKLIEIDPLLAYQFSVDTE